MNRAKNYNSTVLPPQDLEGMLDLSRFLEQLDGPAALVGPDGQTVALPEEAFQILSEVVKSMGLGKAVTVAPVDHMLTTQEAADFLGISRPTFVKKLEQGLVPFERTSGGRHRRVRLDDLLSYRQAHSSERGAALDFLTAEASEIGLYDDDAESYAEALKTVRGRFSYPQGEPERG